MYQTMRTIYYSHKTAEKQPRFHIFLQKLFGVIFFPCTEGIILACTGNAAHFPMGSEVNLIFGGNVAHVFSKETEKNLEW